MDIDLRQARLCDRPRIYEMLAESDATSEMMGPPTYPDHPVPDYDEFCADYDESAFSESGDFRLFMITSEGRDIGSLSYFIREGVAEIDLWIGDKRDWNHGFGPKAISLAFEILRRKQIASVAIIRPSARNRRAIAAYRKAGFNHYDSSNHSVPSWCLSDGFDYHDAVVLVRDISSL